jgi:Uma2 family endonuclease
MLIETIMPAQPSALPQRRLFTVDDYYRMADAGILAEDDSVELIEGDIIRMSPVGSRHASRVKKLIRLLTMKLGEAVIVAAQDPVHLSDLSEPEPDLSVLRPRDDFYENHHPTPDDVLWLIEVSDSSLEFDHRVKLPLYARHEIRELWVVDLRHTLIEVYRGPEGSQYSDRREVQRGESLSPQSFPDLLLTADEILK